ncbi:MAG: sulfurtransferase [Candidatus Eremiobacteraeota bacterium]|nr:sulfurtransferase [Candidatus Eremiobacteraeota bacterium]
MYTTFIDPKDVIRRIEDPSWVVVDCRHTLADFSAGKRMYDESHIPGAFFADVENELSGPKSGANGRHPMPGAAKFAEVLRGFGVDETSQIVAYDAGGDIFAARMWFLCKWIGHDAVAVLDGGFAAWTKAGYRVTNEILQRPVPGSIVAHPRPELVTDVQRVFENVESCDFTLLDARASDRYAGQNETVDPVGGHIPGARNRWFKENFDNDGRIKSPQKLRAEFEAHGIPPGRIIHQCGSGVSAAVNMLAMEHAGIKGSKIYGGSWSEWIADPARPVKTGSAP